MLYEDERIICSAIYYKDNKQHPHQPINIDSGFVICGYRHCNVLSTANILDCKVERINQIQGFLTNKNRFFDRRISKIIAIRSGQIKDSRFDELYSEDLY